METIKIDLALKICEFFRMYDYWEYVDTLDNEYGGDIDRMVSGLASFMEDPDGLESIIEEISDYENDDSEILVMNIKLIEDKEIKS